MIASLFFPEKRVNFSEFTQALIFLYIFCYFPLYNATSFLESRDLIISTVLLWGYIELYLFRVRDIGKSSVVYFFLLNLIPSSICVFVLSYFDSGDYYIFLSGYLMLSIIVFYLFENEIYSDYNKVYFYLRYYNSNVKIHYSHLREVQKEHLLVDLHNDVLICVDYLGNAKAFYHELNIEKNLDKLEGRLFLVSKEKIKS